MKHIYTGIVLLLLLIPLSGRAQQQQKRFSATAIDQAEHTNLNHLFTKYGLYHIATNELAQYVQTTANQGTYLTIDFPGTTTLQLFLHERDILTKDYQLRAGSADGIQPFPRPACMTYAGWLANDRYSTLALTITNTLLYGMIRDKQKAYFIEPLWYLDKDAPHDIYVLYETADVVPIPGNPCGVTEVAKRAENMAPDETGNKGTGTATGTCRMIEMAIASDDSMYNRFKSVAAVQEHNISVMNLVVETYSNAQLVVSGVPQYLEFLIKTQYVATTLATNPFSPNYGGVNASAILAAFRNWGNVAANFNTTFDLGQVWTTRDIGSYSSVVAGDTVWNRSVVGLAYVGTTCGSFRYQLIEKFASGASMASCVSHETGHNLSASHDTSGSPYIMAPSVSNPPATAFSTTSIGSFNTHLASGAVNCLSDCNAAAPVAQFNASASAVCFGSPVTFTNYSVGQVTSVSWSFPGGSPSTSTSNAQAVTYSTAGMKTISLTATNATGSNTISKTIFVGNPPTTPCVNSISCGANRTGLLNVNIGNIGHNTGTVTINGSSASYVCTDNTVLIPNTNYQVAMRIGFPNQAPAINSTAALYLDYNNDGDFSDANETLHTGTTCMEGWYTFNITTPAAVPVTDTWLTLRAVARTCSNASTNACATGCANVEDYGVYFAAVASPLPVSLISFEGKHNSNKNELYWQTGSAGNVDYFMVERSLDGTVFNMVGVVNAKDKDQQVHSYSITDDVTSFEKNKPVYYRLDIRGKNGEKQYSRVLTLMGDDQHNGQLSLYPNPVERGNILQVKTENNTGATIEVFNNLGQHIYQTIISNGQQDVKINIPPTWPAGVYFVKVKSATGAYTQQIIVR